ncbi:hypothetical protein [Streptomyces sp. NPDC005336]|uniref:hypothetical protein n=1 Tax=Streptomyces sp. NPDC005336 TaxID=3157035 RepID=UPI0033B7991B
MEPTHRTEEGAQNTRAGLWHFGLFTVSGLAEELAQGRERVLLEHFYGYALEMRAIRPADVDTYLRSYARPGRLANSFAYYRNVAADTAAITELARTELPMPALAVGSGLAGGPAPSTASPRRPRRPAAPSSPTAATSSRRSSRGSSWSCYGRSWRRRTRPSTPCGCPDGGP